MFKEILREIIEGDESLTVIETAALAEKRLNRTVTADAVYNTRRLIQKSKSEAKFFVQNLFHNQ